MKYKLTIGKHTRFEQGRAVRYMAGDVFEPTKAELVTIGDRLEAVIEKVEEGPADTESKSETSDEEDQQQTGEKEGQGAEGGFVSADANYVIGQGWEGETLVPRALIDGLVSGDLQAEKPEPETTPDENQPEPEPKPKRQPRRKSEN